MPPTQRGFNALQTDVETPHFMHVVCLCVFAAQITGRYYSPRAVQLNGGDIAIVFMNSEGVYFLRAGLSQLGAA